jgi:diguanylate cyclase (GGDEF)-like protein
MVLRYKGAVPSDMLVADFQEHVDWFTDIVRVAFFYAGQDIDVRLRPPSAFAEYIKNTPEITEIIKEESIHRLDEVHENLAKTAAEFIDRSRASQPITVDLYKRLEEQMDAYALQLRRIEDEVMASGFSIDPVTGLRSVSGMKDDVSREMDRRDRKNVPFCVCNLSLDDKSINSDAYDRKYVEDLYRQIGSRMTGVLRSFDDAYHLGRGEFILCLKHVDMLDACSVMERFIEQISNMTVRLDDGRVLQSTASAGVVEPIPGDDIDGILNNARQTRIEAQEEGGNLVFQHAEKSTLAAQMASKPFDGF